MQEAQAAVAGLAGLPKGLRVVWGGQFGEPAARRRACLRWWCRSRWAPSSCC
ncbi:hypothetical protein ACU4GD_23160 [Cupriavidus basilensis]